MRDRLLRAAKGGTSDQQREETIALTEYQVAHLAPLVADLHEARGRLGSVLRTMLIGRMDLTPYESWGLSDDGRAALLMRRADPPTANEPTGDEGGPSDG